MHDPFESVVELDWYPSPITLRRFGVAATVLFAWLAFVAQRHALPVALPLALCACAAMCAAFAWHRPAWNRPLYLLFTCLSFPLRWLLAWAALILLFFLVLTPIAIVVRRLRKRPTQTTDAGWLPARPRRDKAHYFQQS